MSHHDEQRSPEEIEKEIHRSRERLDTTLNELEERFSPQRLLNASYDYLRHGGANEFFSNLGTTIKENPVPFLVTGVGLGWLLTAQRGGARPSGNLANSEAYPHSGPTGDVFRSSDISAGRHAGDDIHAPFGGGHAAGLDAGLAGEPSRRPPSSAFSHPPAFDERNHREPSGFGHSMDEHGPGLKERLADKAHHLGERAHHWRDDMRDGTSHLYHASRHGAQDASRWARDAGHQTSHFIQEHPLVAGALGFAIGAALGGLLPSTRREDAALGEYRDRLMSEAAERGHEQADKMQHALHERTEKMKDDTDKTHKQDEHRQEHDPRHTPSDTDSEHMRYSDEAMPGHNAPSGQSGHPGHQPTPHDKDSRRNEHGLANSDTPSGNTQGDDTLEPPKR